MKGHLRRASHGSSTNLNESTHDSVHSNVANVCSTIAHNTVYAPNSSHREATQAGGA